MNLSKKEKRGFEKIRNKQFTNFQSELEKQKSTKFLTRKEVSKLLSISYPTIWRYTKQGILISYSIGSRVLFKEDEVFNSIVQLKR